jgi:protein SCO1
MTASRPVRVAISVGGLALATALALVARAMRPKPALPVYGEVPAFHLVDQRGAPYGSDSMIGRVTVVDFVFTHCQASCPRLTARMGELQSRLVGEYADVAFVSFSVDPENDTPAVLADYAASAHADPARWTFVTGPLGDIEDAAVRGFKVSTAKVAKGAGDYDVIHGDWFVLVDRAGRLRGYYPTDTAPDVDHLLDDVRRLDKEKR